MRKIPSWAEIEGTEYYSTLDTDTKKKVFEGWASDVREESKAVGAYTEETIGNLFASVSARIDAETSDPFHAAQTSADVFAKVKENEFGGYEPEVVAFHKKRYEDNAIKLLRAAEGGRKGESDEDLRKTLYGAPNWGRALLNKFLTGSEQVGAAAVQGLTRITENLVQQNISLDPLTGRPIPLPEDLRLSKEEVKAATGEIKSFRKSLKDYSDKAEERLPSDPRIGSKMNAFLSGVGQMPANLISAPFTLENAALNFAQMYEEDNAGMLAAAKRKGARDAGVKDPEAWFRSLPEEQREAIESDTSAKALIPALLNAGVETVADKILIGKLVPKGALKFFGALRESGGKTAKAIEFLGRQSYKTVAEAGQEVEQGLTSQAAQRTVDPETNLTEGAWDNFFGGLGGASVTAPLTIAQTLNEIKEARLEYKAMMAEKQGSPATAEELRKKADAMSDPAAIRATAVEVAQTFNKTADDAISEAASQLDEELAKEDTQTEQKPPATPAPESEGAQTAGGVVSPPASPVVEPPVPPTPADEQTPTQPQEQGDGQTPLPQQQPAPAAETPVEKAPEPAASEVAPEPQTPAPEVSSATAPADAVVSSAPETTGSPELIAGEGDLNSAYEKLLARKADAEMMGDEDAVSAADEAARKFEKDNESFIRQRNAKINEQGGGDSETQILQKEQGDQEITPSPEVPAGVVEPAKQEIPPAAPQPAAPAAKPAKKSQGNKMVVKKNGVIPTRTNEKGEVEFEFVNDPDTMAEALNAAKGGRVIYIPDDVIDNEALPDTMDFAFEKGTGRAYLTKATHSRYPEAPILFTGQTEDGKTLDQLYREDPKRQERSEKQRESAAKKSGAANADEFVHPLEQPDIITRINDAGESTFEKENPKKVAGVLDAISKEAQSLAGEPYKNADGDSLVIGPVMAERIGAAATRLYFGRLRKVEGISGKRIYPADVIRDVKSKFLGYLKSRKGGAAMPTDAEGNPITEQIQDKTATEDATDEARAASRNTTPTLAEAAPESQAAETAAPVEESATSGTRADRMFQAMETALAGMPAEEADYAKGAFALLSEDRTAKLSPRQRKAFEDLSKRMREIMEDTPPTEEGIEIYGNGTLTKEGELELAKATSKANSDALSDLDPLNIFGDFNSTIDALIKSDKVSPIARMLLKKFREIGHDFSGVELRIIRDTTRRWAGLYTPAYNGRGPVITLNLAHKQNIAETLAHEAFHHVSYWKLRRGYPRNEVERKAWNDLRKVLTHIRKLVVPNEEMAASGLTRSRAARKMAAQGGMFYGMMDLDELFSEVASNPQFATWLENQAPIDGLEIGKKSWFRNLLEQIKALFKTHLAGEEVPPRSLLDNALEAMFRLAETPGDTDLYYRRRAGGVEARPFITGKTTSIIGKNLRDVQHRAIPEDPDFEWVDPTDEVTARKVVGGHVYSEDELRAGAATGKLPITSVRFRIADRDTAGITGDNDPLNARVTHSITEESDRKTLNPGKVRSARAIPSTLLNPDFVVDEGSSEKNLRLSFVKLYADPESPTGVRWHVVRTINGEYRTQYSNPDLSGAVRNGEVIAVGKKAPKGGRQQGTVAEPKLQETNAPKGVENVDNRDIENVQQKLLERAERLDAAVKDAHERGDFRTAEKLLAELSEVEQEFDALTVQSKAPDLRFAQSKTGKQTDPDPELLDNIRKVTEEYKNLIVEESDLIGSSPMAAGFRGNNPILFVNSGALKSDLDSVRPEDRPAYLQALIFHETAHFGSILNDMNEADSKNRTGKEKLEGWFNDVMDDAMREETAERYVRKDIANREEVKKAFLKDEAAVAAEHKRMLYERFYRGHTEEDIYAYFKSLTGNKLVDAIRGLMHYVRGRIVKLRTMLDVRFDPRLAAELAGSRAMLDKIKGMKENTLVAHKVDFEAQGDFFQRESKKAGYDSYDLAPAGFQNELSERWRKIHDRPWVDPDKVWGVRKAAIQRLETAGEFLLRYAREKGEDLFYLGDNLSKSTDLAEVLDSTGEKFSVVEMGDPSSLWISTAVSAQSGDSVVFSDGPGQWGVATLIKREGDVSTVRMGDGSVRQFPTSRIADDGRAIMLYERSPGRWVIDSSSGTLRKTINAYQGIYRWAANSGVQIAPDTSTSWSGNHRRNAHMLSSALREQSAEHLVPTDEQLSRMFEGGNRAEQWQKASPAEKVDALIRAEISYVEQALPGIVKFNYDFRTNTVSYEGGTLDSRSFGQRLRETIQLQKESPEGVSEPERIGVRTALRYLAAKSLIRGEAGGMASLGDNIPTLTGVFYASPKTSQFDTKSTRRASGPLGKGKLTFPEFSALLKKNQQVEAASYRVDQETRKLKGLLAREENKSVTPQQINEALGNKDNPLTEAQEAEVKVLRSAAADASLKARATKLAGKSEAEIEAAKKFAEDAKNAANAKLQQHLSANRAAAKAKVEAARMALPPEIREVVDSMRRRIDALSEALIKAGAISKDLIPTVEANMEIYLHRAYEIFDNPRWAEFVKHSDDPKAQKVRNDALRMFRSRLITDKALEILKKDPTVSRADAIQQGAAATTDQEVENLLLEYLNVANRKSLWQMTGGQPGRKNLSILKRRGVIDPRLRALWGEYQDPSVNFGKTYGKMAAFLAEHKFQQDLLSAGMKEGYLWEASEGDTIHPTGWVEVMPGLNNSPSPNPMQGVYGPPELAEALMDAKVRPQLDGFFGLVNKLTGWAMASKTVYNIPLTPIRNFLSNIMIAAQNGYFFDGGTVAGLRGAAAITENGKTFVYAGGNKSQAVIDEVERLIELGVYDDNVKASVIRDLTEAAFSDPDKFLEGRFDKVLEVKNEVNDRIVRSYQDGDNFWKYIGFKSELATIKAAFPEKSPAEQEQMAADRVRRVMPTYSEIYNVVQKLVKRQPFVAPFISWTSERIRNNIEMIKMIGEDARSGNPVLRASAIRRALGLAATRAAFLMIPVIVKSMSGIDDEEEEALRRNLSEWQENAQLAIFGGKTDKDGQVEWTFWDLSYLDPDQLFVEPLIALSRGSSTWDALTGAASTLLEPWTNEQLLAGAVMDAARNTTKEGRPLVNTQDSKFEQWKAKLGHIGATMLPGTVFILERIRKALTGEIPKSGRAYNLANELTGPVIGQRIGTCSPLQSFQMGQVTRFARARQEARNLATKEYRTMGTPDIAEIKRQYTQANTSYKNNLAELRKDFLAQVKLGVQESQVLQAMKSGGVTEAEINMVVGNTYVRYTPRQETIEEGTLRVNGMDRYKALREAEAAYPETQPLTAD